MFPYPLMRQMLILSLKGVRTIFSAFHHFDNCTAREVIKNAVEAKQAIGIFDGGDKNLFMIVATIINKFLSPPSKIPMACFASTAFLMTSLAVQLSKW